MGSCCDNPHHCAPFPGHCHWKPAGDDLLSGQQSPAHSQ
uniref:Uncharacterized protein n=1 Tax=Anguilla anguilla TaxID=7936 RepID=A0A0E9TZN5_ANGAN